MTEEIVTRFSADISGLEEGITAAASKLKKYEDFADGAAASGNQLSSNLGSLTAKTMALEGVQRKVIAAEKDHAATLTTTAKAARDLATAQGKVGDVSGFKAAGKAATEEGARIDALIVKINQLRAAHAAAGSVQLKAPIAAQIGTAQQELSAIPVPQGATNTADIAAALAPLQAIQQQAPLAAAAVDKAAADINADLAGIGPGPGPGVLKVFDDLEAKTVSITGKIGALSSNQTAAVTTASDIVKQYREIQATGEKLPGQLKALQLNAESSLVVLTEIADEEERALRAAIERGTKVTNARAILESKDLTDAQKQAAAATAGVTKEYDELAAAAKRSSDVGKKGAQDQLGLLTQLQSRIDLLNQKKLSLVDPKKIAQTNAELKKLTNEFNRLSNAQPGGDAGIGGLFKRLGGPAQGLIGQATSGLGGLGNIFSSLTGPVGLVIGAVAALGAGLVKVFANTDAGATKLEGLGRTGGIAFDKLTGSVTGFFDRLSAGDSAFGRFAEGIGKAATFAFEKLLPIGIILDKIGALAGLKDAAKDGQELAQVYDDLEDKQIALVESNAKNERQINKLNIELRDRTKTDAERLEIAAQIAKLEKERAQNELDFLADKTAAKQKEIDIQERNKNGPADDALRLELAEAKAAEENAAAQSEGLLERTQNRKNLIVEQGEAERLRISQKAEEAERKRAELVVKRAELEKQTGDIVTGLQDEQLRAGLKARDQEAFDIDAKYTGLVDRATKAFADLRKLAGEGTPGADTAAIADIAAKEKEVQAQIRAAQEAAQKTATQKANADELKARVDFNTQVEDLVADSNATQLDQLRSRVEAGERLTGDDFTRYLALIEEVNQQEIKAAQDKYAKLLEDNAKFNSDANGLTAQGKTNEANIIATKDAEIAAANAQAQAARNAETFARMQENVAILSAAADQGLQVLAQSMATGEGLNKDAAKQLIILLLDTLEKIILMNTAAAATGAIAGNAAAGPFGVAKGIVEAALVTVLIKGMFAAVKAAIGASYEGEPYVTGKPTWSGRDGHLRRVHEGERIVTAKTNAKHYDLFQAAEDGTLQDYLRAQYVMPAINRYLDSDDGRRASSSVMLAPYYDANIVKGLKSNKEATDKTNALLLMLVKQKPRVVKPSPRTIAR